MTEPCRWASLHWLRFADIRTPDMLDLSRMPAGAGSWKIGPDGEPAPDGSRRPSEVWCAVGLYADRSAAEGAVSDPGACIPFLPETTEAWHALLLPVAHRGECNHLDPACPGLMLQPHDDDPGGTLVVITTAGFVLGPDLDMNRVIDFRRNVDAVRAAAATAAGNVARQVFVPHVRGEDGVTMTIWRDDAAMSAFAYRPGDHRARIDRYKREQTCDRTSFTRLRVLRTSGTWDRCDPAVAATA